jgi:hypothetical protein
MMHPFLLLMTAFLDASLTIADVHGVPRHPLDPNPAAFAAVFFVTHDCPISNYYAPEIRRLCAEYADRGVTCRLVYVDPSLTDAGALAHARSYDLDNLDFGSSSIVVDRDHRLVHETGVTIAPEVVVITPDGRIGYRGRIDDFYVAWGQSRREPHTRDLRDTLDAMLAGAPVARPETPAVGCIIGDLLRAR